jgi:hypothetical protein
MTLLAPVSIGALALAGLAIFWFRYRGKRSRLAGLAAFGLGLFAVAAFTATHALFEAEGRVGQQISFLIHIMMCVSLLLLLWAVMRLRNPSNRRYHMIESLAGITLGSAALMLWVAIAWQSPQNEDAVVQMLVRIIPFLIVVAIAARFGWGMEGMIGAGSFVALGLSYLVYSDESLAAISVSAALQFAGIIGMLIFFYIVSASAERHPYSNG